MILFALAVYSPPLLSMRAYLRRGKPIGQRQPPQKPITLVLCTCTECCTNYTALDPRTGKMVPGRLVGRQMALTHRKHGGAPPLPSEDDPPVDSEDPIDNPHTNPLPSEQ